MPDSKTPAPPAGRLRPPKAILGLFALVAVAVAILNLFNPLGDTGGTNFFTQILLGLAFFVYLVWFTFWSGFPWKTRVLPAGALTVFLVIFFSIFRLDRLTGEMVPRFVLRSEPRHDLTLEVPEPGSGQVDLVTTTAEDFPQFLGPGRRNAVESPTLARDWTSQPPRLLWRQSIGAGWSSFAVANGYAVTMEQRGDEELVTCYDLETGELQWSFGHTTRFETIIAGIGPRATPTVDEGRVYAMGANGLFVALDGRDGNLLWQYDLAALAGFPPGEAPSASAYGYASSPLVVDDRVIIPLGGPEGESSSLIAFDKVTGEELWRGGDRHMSCASPTVATLGGVEQILNVNEGNVSGHDPATGAVLWEVPWSGKTNANASVSQPVPLPPNRVFLSKGYGVGAALVELTAKADGTFDAEFLWQSPRSLRTKFTNVTTFDGHVYGLSDGILECVDLETGERCWKKGRYRQGQLMRVGDVLLVLAESGEVIMVEATPEEHRELTRFQAVEGKTWNHLAIYGTLLLVRNGEEAAVYELPVT